MVTHFAILLIFLLTFSLHGYGQHVYVDLTAQGQPFNPLLRPGYMYNNLTVDAATIFSNSDMTLNSIRVSNIEYKIRSSTSYSQCLQAIQSTKNWHIARAQDADKLIIIIAGTPYWISSSTNTEPTGSGWYYYMTVKPDNYTLWDQLMTDIAEEIKSWNIDVYYEIWNEPDLTDFWNGTESELLELYQHTANALKITDPFAMVGGMAVNGYTRGVPNNSPVIYGYYPDTIADQYCFTAQLINYCQDNAVPLDFVSFHSFSAYPGAVKYGSEYLKSRLDSAGFCNTEILVTEYNISSSYRETEVQIPYFIRNFQQISGWPVNGHTIAALQDYSLDPDDEFFGDYGTISRNAFIKPCYYANWLAYQVIENNQQIPLSSDEPIFGFAGKNEDKVSLILANFMQDPVMAGYDKLLYDNHPINTIDLYNAGYTNWDMITNTITGNLQPIGPPEIVAAFEDANLQYCWADARFGQITDYQVHFKNLIPGQTGTSCLIDLNHNNIITKYDSLINAGYSNAEAILILHDIEEFVMTLFEVYDSVVTIPLYSNSVYYLTIEGVILGENNFPEHLPSDFSLFPNPASDIVNISIDNDDFIFNILDMSGQTIISLKNTKQTNIAALKKGIYIASVQRQGLTSFRKLIKN